MLIDSNSKLVIQTESNFAQVLMNRTQEAAFCLGANGQFIYANDATCQMSEYSREELLSMTLDEIDVDFSPQVWLEIWEALKSHSLTFESHYRSKTGRMLKMQINISYAKDRDNEFCCAFARQINDEVLLRTQHADKSNDCDRNLEEGLKTSLSLSHSILESTASGIIAVNLKGEVVYHNQKFMDMWQLPRTVNISKRYKRIKAVFEAQVKDLETFR